MSRAADSRRASRTLRRLPKAATSLALAFSLTLAGSVHAATVRAVQGQVLVNSGEGYRLVDGTITLGVGGTVVANPGAVARVTYPGGCQVTVEAGSIYQIASQAPCQTGEPTKTGALEEKGSTTTSSGGVNPWLLAGGGLAIGVGAVYGLQHAMSP